MKLSISTILTGLLLTNIAICEASPKLSCQQYRDSVMEKVNDIDFYDQALKDTLQKRTELDKYGTTHFINMANSFGSLKPYREYTKLQNTFHKYQASYPSELAKIQNEAQEIDERSSEKLMSAMREFDSYSNACPEAAQELADTLWQRENILEPKEINQEEQQ